MRLVLCIVVLALAVTASASAGASETVLRAGLAPVAPVTSASFVRSIWRDLQAHGARIVVETKAHRAGELRGTLAQA